MELPLTVVTNGSSWEIQDQPPGPFSSDNLIWHPGDFAYIPWNRIDDFRDGEGRRDPTCESSFHIRSSKTPKSNQLCQWSEYIIFWCSFGPSEEPTVVPAVPPMNGTYPSTGPGSRTRNRKKLFNNHRKRGCQCHFIVRRFNERPSAAHISFQNRYCPLVYVLQ